MRRWLRSWWILLTLAPFGWLAWAAFLWAGLRAKRYRWLAFAALFLAVIPVEFMTSDGWSALLMFGAWIAGPIVALFIRGEYLRRTEAYATPRAREAAPVDTAARPVPDAPTATRPRGDEQPKPTFMLRNAFMRRVVMPLFALCVFGFGVACASIAITDFSPRMVAMAFMFTAIGLMMIYGIFAAEQRYGRYAMPRFLRPRLRHSLHTGSATGLNEYELRTPLAARLAMAGAITSFFLLPHIEWEPPLWVTVALATLGSLAAAPVIRGGRSVLRIGDNRLEFEGSGTTVRATAWDAATVEVHGNPMTYLFLADGDAAVAASAQLLHRTNSMLGEDPSERLNVQSFIDAARHAGADVEEALRRDFERGAPEDRASREDEPSPFDEDIFSRPPGSTADAVGAR